MVTFVPPRITGSVCCYRVKANVLPVHPLCIVAEFFCLYFLAVFHRRGELNTVSV